MFYHDTFFDSILLHACEKSETYAIYRHNITLSYVRRIYFIFKPPDRIISLPSSIINVCYYNYFFHLNIFPVVRILYNIICSFVGRFNMKRSVCTSGAHILTNVPTTFHVCYCSGRDLSAWNHNTILLERQNI